MSLLERIESLKAEARVKVAMVLDASESATPHWSNIASLTNQLLDSLPANLQCSLYFLGNPTPYQPSQFHRQAAQWYQDNSRRLSVITPIFERLQGHKELTTIAIIGSGQIFDLEDWADSALVRKTLLVSVRESLRGKLRGVEELVRPTAQQVCGHLHDPVIGVRISAVGFMPTWWNNSGYHLTITGGEASLTAAQLPDYSITLRYLVEAGSQVQGRLTHASGRETFVSLKPMEASALQPGAFTPLTPEEEAIFCNAIQQRPFTCLHCHSQHPWDTLYCQSGASILGELIYPSLTRAKATGFVLFRQGKSQVGFYPHGCDVLWIGKDCVAIREGNRARIYRYDEGQACWRPTGQSLSCYCKLPGDVYVAIV